MTTKPINILIFGYYFRQNFGDDLFKYVFENYIFTSSSFKGVTPKLIFKNIEDLDNDIDIYNSIDKVIIGGGDLINNFFSLIINYILINFCFVSRSVHEIVHLR